MNDNLCIISCGKTKIWDRNNNCHIEIEAKDAYVGVLFRKNREFAEAFFEGHYLILSDKYGLIPPETRIRNYNVSPLEVRNNLLFFNLLQYQLQEMKLRPSEIIVTSGNIHMSIIKKLFEGKEIISPLSGLGQGKRMKKLKEMIESGSIY